MVKAGIKNVCSHSGCSHRGSKSNIHLRGFCRRRRRPAQAAKTCHSSTFIIYHSAYLLVCRVIRSRRC